MGDDTHTHNERVLNTDMCAHFLSTGVVEHVLNERLVLAERAKRPPYLLFAARFPTVPTVGWEGKT
jgi:hypothetical protein